MTSHKKFDTLKMLMLFVEGLEGEGHQPGGK
jgi:hypothetical protein